MQPWSVIKEYVTYCFFCFEVNQAVYAWSYYHIWECIENHATYVGQNLGHKYWTFHTSQVDYRVVATNAQRPKTFCGCTIN